MYYFAYGSNMNGAQMKQRCPQSYFIGTASLANYRFVYDGWSENRQSSVANIVYDSNNIVYGCIYKLNDESLKLLDHFENYPKNYQHLEINVQPTNEKTRDVKAVTYYRSPAPIASPSNHYRELVFSSALERGLPGFYVQNILDSPDAS